MSSRCAIVAVWDSEGKLRPYMEHYLLALTEICSKVVVVVNGKCEEEMRSQVEKLGAECLIRNNEGYDFGAYQYGVMYLGFDSLKKYDQLIICNSSCYGPITSLNSVFDCMNRKQIDFWGITQWVGSSWPTHIQSYFLVFERQIIQSDSFKNYWEKMLLVENRLEAIVCLESRLTGYFASQGFTWDTYIPKECYWPSYPDCSMNDDVILQVLAKGLPFLKRKLVVELSSQLQKYTKLISQLEKLGYSTSLLDITPSVYNGRSSLIRKIKKILRKNDIYNAFHKAIQEAIYYKVLIRFFLHNLKQK